MFVVGDSLVFDYELKKDRVCNMYKVTRAYIDSYSRIRYDVVHEGTGALHTNQSMDGFVRFGPREPVDLQKWIK